MTEAAQVLLVDAERTSRRALATVLGHLVGVEVIAARSFDGAMARLVSGPVDLVVADLGHPGGEALSFLAELSRAGRQVPLVFLSTELRQREGWLLTRVDVEVHPKPIAPSRLREVVLRRLDTGRTSADESPFSVADCLQIARMGRRTVQLDVSRSGGKLGVISVVGGEVWSAQSGARSGEAALLQMATARDSVAQVSPLPRAPHRDVATSWEQLALEADRWLADEVQPAPGASVDDPGFGALDAGTPDPESSLTGYIDALAGELAELRIQEGLEAMLREDHAAAWLAFSAAAAADPEHPTVRHHLERLRTLGYE